MKLFQSIETSLRRFDQWNILAILLFILNAIIRAWKNDFTSMSRDEPFTLYFSQLSPTEFVPIILDTNNPPTFEIILHYWRMLFGAGEGTLRMLPTLIISLGAIPVYSLGKRLDGYAGALFVSILYLYSGLLMNFSHLDRAYCFLITGAAFMMHYFIVYYETNKGKYLFFWAISAFVTCGSHYFGWIVVAVQWAALLTSIEFRRKLIRGFMLSNIALVLMYLPLAAYLVKRFVATSRDSPESNSIEAIQSVSLLVDQYLNSGLLTLLLAMLGLFLGVSLAIKFRWMSAPAILSISGFFLLSHPLIGFEKTITLNIILSFLLAASLVFSTIATLRSNIPPTGKLVIYWALLPIAGGFFISMGIQIFNDRYLSFALPALLLLIVLICKEISSPWAKIFSYGSVLSLFLFGFSYTPNYNVDNREAIEIFRSYASKSELCIVGPGYHDLDFVYYFNRDIFYNGAFHITDTLGNKIVHEEGYTRYKEGLRRELYRNNIIVSHDSSSLHINPAINTIAYYDGNTKLVYPKNGILEYLILRFGEPAESQSFSGVYTIYRFCKKN